MACDVKAVHVGKAEVQDGDVHAAAHRLNGVPAGLRQMHVVSLPPEGAQEWSGDRGVVLYKKHLRHELILMQFR